MSKRESGGGGSQVVCRDPIPEGLTGRDGASGVYAKCTGRPWEGLSKAAAGSHLLFHGALGAAWSQGAKENRKAHQEALTAK